MLREDRQEDLIADAEFQISKHIGGAGAVESGAKSSVKQTVVPERSEEKTSSTIDDWNKESTPEGNGAPWDESPYQIGDNGLVYYDQTS